MEEENSSKITHIAIFDRQENGEIYSSEIFIQMTILPAE